MNFIPGYLILAIDFFQIFYPCLLGTFLEIYCESFYVSMCQLSWVDLPVSDQKSLLILMNASMKMQSMTFGLMDLNLNTFIEVTTTVSNFLIDVNSHFIYRFIKIFIHILRFLKVWSNSLTL